MIMPKLFIGSSYEARKTAYDFANALSKEATCIVWEVAPEFDPTHGTLPSLLSACHGYDFGLFLLTPDDNIDFRGEKGKSARDNVLLELGLFLGALGADRTFAVVQVDDRGQPSVKTTSDLAGIKIPRFTQDADDHVRTSSITNAVHSIRTKINKIGVRPIDFRDIQWGYSVSKKSLHVTIPKQEIARLAPQLVGKFFMIVGRKQTEETDFSEDNLTAKSKPREMSQHLTNSFRIELKNHSLFEGAKPGDEIEACFFMTPSNEGFLKEVLTELTALELRKLGCRPLLQLNCRASQ